jgi:hypothetical protein
MNKLCKEASSKKFDISDIINSPPHYVEGRSIQPIDVIEDWGLGHHLACVVKYIARVGRKNAITEDLRKATWYLERALLKAKDDSKPFFLSLETHEITYLEYHPQAICDDWHLSDLLCSALINIYLSFGHQSHYMKEKSLKAALGCLREEIILQEQHAVLKESKSCHSKNISLIVKDIPNQYAASVSKKFV